MALTSPENNCYQATLGTLDVSPSKVALWHLPPGQKTDVAVTYGDLQAEIHRVAGVLRERGVGYGDRVLVLLPMSPALYAVIWGIAQVGAATVIVDPAAGMRPLARALAHATPKAVFTPDGLGRLVRWLPGVNAIPHVFSVNLHAPVFSEQPEDPVVCPVLPTDAVSIVYTTGSTGEPKPVQRSHGYLLAMLAALNQHPAKHPEAVDMPMWPNLVFDALCHGRTCVLPASASGRLAMTHPEVLAGQMQRCGVTMWVGPPGPLEKLLDWLAQTGASLPLTHVFAGGALVPPGLLRRAQACLLPGGEALAVYGSTETDPVALVSALEVPDAPSASGVCIGRLHPDLRLRLVHPRETALTWEEAQEVAPGEVGEIWVAGPHVNVYLDPSAPEARRTKVAAPDGTVWHRMGDLAWQDEEQRLFLMGRMAQRVVIPEGAIDAIPVELTALHVPGVKRAALLGRNGQAWLVAEPAPEADPYSLFQALTEAVQAFGVHRVVLHPHMPVDTRHHSRVDLHSLALDLPDEPPHIPPPSAPPPFLRGLQLYVQERFPLLQTLVGVVLMVATDGLATLALIEQPVHTQALWRMAIVVAIFVGVFFHLRVFDEHKDWSVDRIAFPERILSRGWVTLRQLRWLAGGVIACEILLSAGTGPVLLGWTLVLIAYTWLMLREFYVGEWLRRHLVLYGASHMAIISLMSLAAYGAVLDALPLDVVTKLSGAHGLDATLHGLLPTLAAKVWHPSLLLFAGMNFCLIYSLEVARKIRTPELERPQVDTYSRRLGIPGALVLVIGTQLTGLALLALASPALHVPLVVFAVGLATIAFVAWRFRMFYLNPTAKGSKRLEATGALTLINLNIALILYWGFLR